MPAPEDLQLMGYVSAPFGVRGWVKAHVFTESLRDLLDYPAWWLGSRESWRCYPVAEASVHGKFLIARLAEVGDRETATWLTGSQIAVPRSEMPPPEEGEYYWADLIGLAVVNARGEVLGTVTGLLETGANDVLRVLRERERLIPFVDPVVLAVDLAASVIRVDWEADYL